MENEATNSSINQTPTLQSQDDHEHQFNQKHSQRLVIAIFFLFVIGIVAAAAYYVGTQSTKMVPPTSISPTTLINPSSAPVAQSLDAQNLKTYSSTDFSLEYPSVFQQKTPKEVTDAGGFDVIPLCAAKDLTVCFYLPTQTLPETTGSQFSGASLSVGVTPQSTLDSCEQYKEDERLQGYTDFKIVSETHNGISFSKLELGGAAAGHQNRETLYRKLKDGKCYELDASLDLQTADTEPPTRTFTQSDQAKIDTLFSQIISTFKFTN